MAVIGLTHISIIIWEVIKYIKKNNEEEQKYLLMNESGKELDNAEDNHRKYLEYDSRARLSLRDLSTYEARESS